MKINFADIQSERMRADLRYLTSDPLPCRTLNYTVPGHEQCTLYEADDYICSQLSAAGYNPEVDLIPVQAWVADHEKPWGFRDPLPQEIWYNARNIWAIKQGLKNDDIILLVAHKDSQSWLPLAPGAYDNGVGIVAVLEICRILASARLDSSVGFLFCNEEHHPWTSINAAEKISISDLNVKAVLNIDSIGGKEDSAFMQSCTRYTTKEGRKIALLMKELNDHYSFGLNHSSVKNDMPNDDDGSFINAGIANAVLVIGSYPYSDPMYHTIFDTFERVDMENVLQTTKLILATVYHLAASKVNLVLN